MKGRQVRSSENCWDWNQLLIKTDFCVRGWAQNYKGYIKIGGISCNLCSGAAQKISVVDKSTLRAWL